MENIEAYLDIRVVVVPGYQYENAPGYGCRIPRTRSIEDEATHEVEAEEGFGHR